MVFKCLKADNNIYCLKKTSVYYVNERRGMKLLNNQGSNEEICLQIDSNLQTLNVNLEIAPLTRQLANSLVSSIRLFLFNNKKI